MDLPDLTNRLTDEKKKRLAEAKSPEELKALLAEAGLELSDDALNEIAGGCFRPNFTPVKYWTCTCTRCEATLEIEADFEPSCPFCGYPFDHAELVESYDYRVL